MPTGRLRPGRVKIAGVVTTEVHDALLAYEKERDLPTMSQTVGAALQEWLEIRCGRVQNPAQAREGRK